MKLLKIKQGAIVRCYHLTNYLKPVLKQLEYIDGILVMNYRFTDVSTSKDKTARIVKKLKQKNITLLKGDEQLQQDVFNRALKIFEELKFDWVWINDADEFIQKRDRDTIISYLNTHSYDGGTTNVIDYTAKDKIAEIRTHKPTIIVRPFVRFRETRCADYSNYYFKDIYMHHFGHMNNRKWKQKNLWYPKKDFNKVIHTKYSKYEMPQEIKELIK